MPDVNHVALPPGNLPPPRGLAKALDRLRHDSGFRRLALLGTTGVAVAVIILVTVVFTVLALTSSADSADRLAAAGDVLVGATLLLAAIAAIVALLAYAVSTGLPDLRISVEFNHYPPNNLIFKVEAQARDQFRVEPGSMRPGKVLLRNESGYSARNPALIVRLHSMAFVPERLGDSSIFEANWAINESGNFAGAKGEVLREVQWDGGPTYSIHGHSTRRLPDLDFHDLWFSTLTPPILTFEILAEGYRRVVNVPVLLIVDGEAIVDPETYGKPFPSWL